MADVPIVSLGVQPPQIGGGGAAPINPFQAGVDLMRMQQMGNENRAFQLKQGALAGMGQVMSLHPGDEEGGLREIMANPNLAPYAPDFVNTIRSANQSLATTEKTRAETGEVNLRAGDTAMHVFAKNMFPYYAAVRDGRPQEELDAIANGAVQQTMAATAGMTKQQQQNAVNGVKGWFQSQFANLPENRDDARAQLLTRMSASWGALDLNGPTLEHLRGTPIHVHTEQGDYFGSQQPNGSVIWAAGAPPGATPGFVPAGIAPKLASPGEVPYSGSFGLPSPSTDLGPGGSIGPGTAASPFTPVMASPPNALGGQPPAPPPMPPQADDSQAPPPTAAVAPTAVQPAAAPTAVGTPPTSAAPAPIAGAPRSPFPITQAPISEGTGQPIWDEKTDFTAPGSNLGHWDASGTRWIWNDSGKAEAIQQDQTKWREESRAEIADVARARQQYDFIDNDLDHLAGTVLAPGAGANERLAAAKAWNASMEVAHATGILSDSQFNKFKLSDSDVATAESFLKSTTLAQFTTLTQFLGKQREAAQTIQVALRAVPGIENTYLGNKLVLEGLRSAASRTVDLQRFQQQWLSNPNNHGDLTGSENAFNSRVGNRPEDYANVVLNNFGLTKQGFQSQAAINRAVSNGWITPEVAAEAHNKLPAARPETVTSP